MRGRTVADGVRMLVVPGSVRVRLAADHLSLTEVEAAAGYAASRLTIRIEEPAAGGLFLRFTYESAEEPGSGELDELTRIRRVLTLSRLRTNTPIGRKEFAFDVPSGVRVVDR